MRFQSPARLLLTAILACTPLAAAQADFLEKPDVQRFIDEVGPRHGIAETELRELLGQASHRQEIIDAIRTPAEALPWRRYRPIFLTEERIRGGVEFWAEHEQLLSRISKEYRVPSEILVAIIGVETYYGRFKGRHRVLDALATLAFDYPPRASFFRRELEQYLLLVREEGIDPLAPKGSYAGAMGMPQFISSSYRAYAVDGDGDGKRDLFENPADIIASVANYFRRHRWREGEPVAFPASVSGDDWRQVLDRDLRPRRTVSELRKAGIDFQGSADENMPARLLELEGEEGVEHWLTLHNFYVITRYNHSPLYALAVYQLSQAIRELREES